MSNDKNVRQRVLAELNSDQDVAQEVLDYCANPFINKPADHELPLEDEVHLADWRRYRDEAGAEPFSYLQSKIAQLNIPIQEGISKSDAYGAVARRGTPFNRADFGDAQLVLENPHDFDFFIHPHPAGALPILVTSHRPDFITIYRALGCRSEPVEVMPSVNAQMLAGFNNWDRIKRYREKWAATCNPFGGDSWGSEMKRVVQKDPGQFRDRFIILCQAPYSSLRSEELGLALSAEEWLEKSGVIRLEHEFTHYATKRLFNQMRNNLLDEIIADCMGLTSALGTFKASWFLTFIGLEKHPEIRVDGRIHTYRQELSDSAFELLCQLLPAAALGVEKIVERFYNPDKRAQFLLGLTSMTLELFAAPDRTEIFGGIISN